MRREVPQPYKRRSIPFASLITLPPPTPSCASFAEALARRESGEIFTPPTIVELSNFLNDVGRIRAIDLNDANRQKRKVASMGALHPTHILVDVPNNGWHVYVPDTHALGALQVQADSSAAIIRMGQEHVPGHHGSLLCLLSDCDLVSAYYVNYSSLLLRDAGVLLGHASLVAAAHKLTFRILGRTGTAAVESLVPGLPFNPMATGLALIGAQVEAGGCT